MEEITYKELKRQARGNIYPKIRCVALDQDDCISVILCSTIVLFEHNKELFATKVRIDKKMASGVKTNSRNHAYFYQKFGEEFHQEVLEFIKTVDKESIARHQEIGSKFTREVYKIKEEE